MKGETDCRGAMTGKSPAEFAGARLDKLHADLKLQPEQRRHGPTGRRRSRPARQVSKRPDFEAMSKLPAPGGWRRCWRG